MEGDTRAMIALGLAIIVLAGLAAWGLHEFGAWFIGLAETAAR